MTTTNATPPQDKKSLTVRLAQNKQEVEAAQRLRFIVYHDLGEGLPDSVKTGKDMDPFDDVCDHILVINPENEVVGTYRLQTGTMAQKNRGYYGAQEFDFGPFEHMRGELIELGRASVRKDHQNLFVLGLLWRGIANYAREHHARYLIGCSSLHYRDPAYGAAAHELLAPYLATMELQTTPLPGYVCPLDKVALEKPLEIPPLVLAYLRIGARICGPPAIDNQFGTIDLLTLVDLELIPASVRARFFP